MLRMVRRGGWFLTLLLLGGCDVVFGLDRPPVPPPDAPVPGEWSSLASGGLHTCGIQADHSLWCWGENVYGEVGLGSGTGIEILTPQHVGGDAWTAVTAGALHTCGLHDDGTLWCWGYNGLGIVGDGTHVDRHEPVEIGTDRWSAVAAGEYFTCAIRADQSLWCWGTNMNAQLGDGTIGERASPTLIGSTQTWEAVAAGLAHTCALATDHQLWCWGTGPLGGTVLSMVPKQLEIGTEWSAIAAGNAFTCGIAGGSVRCWGGNLSGELGDGTLTDHTMAASIVSSRTDWTTVKIQYTTACALAADGALACWGENRQGEIGSDTAAPIQTTPHTIDVPSATWKAVAPGTLHTCAIDGDAHLWCSGNNGSGQLGDGSGGSRVEPVQIEGAWSSIKTSEVSTCGIRAGKLWCWGDNSFGQLGEGTTLARQAPVETLMVAPTTKIAVGARHICDINTSQQLWCWGSNSEQQLGGATAAPYVATPTRVVFPQTIAAIASSNHNCIMASDTYAYCWSRNSSGQLGRSSLTPYDGGIALAFDSNLNGALVQAIEAGQKHTCAIGTDGRVRCWGANDEGELGDGTFASKALITLTPIIAAKLSAGGYHNCSIAVGGLLSCWGSNAYGQLGDGTTMVSRANAIQIGTSPWSQISAGLIHTCGIRTDGSLWCWGNNTRGELGLGTRTSSNVPVRVGTAMWAAVSAGTSYTCGIQADASLWCWGNRLWGQLGDNASWTTRFVRVRTL